MFPNPCDSQRIGIGLVIPDIIKRNQAQDYLGISESK